MNRQRLLLLKELGGDWGQITGEQISKIETAMTLFAMEARERAMNKELKDEYVSFFKMIFNSSFENQILWMRYRHYKRAVKLAKSRCKTEGYKMYVVRDSRTKYRVLSTLDFKYNQKLRILKKNVTKQDIERIAALVVHPDGTTTGHGFSAGHEVDEYVREEKPNTNFQVKKKRNRKSK